MESLKSFFTIKTVAIIASAAALLLVVSVVVGVVNGGKRNPEPKAKTPVSATPTPETTPTPSPTPKADDLYADCDAVWAALGRPITSADPGFPATEPNKFDLDSDGIGCEDNPATPEDESSIDWHSIWSKTKHNTKEFGKWSSAELDQLWEKASPGLKNTWDKIKDAIPAP